jgi:Ca2+-binding EF-hand superfamily protein
VNTLGWGIPDAEIVKLMRETDKDGSGTVDLQEFTKMMQEYQFTKDSPISQHLESVFNHYDKDGDGFISNEDFKSVAEELDEIINDKNPDLFIRMAKHFSKLKGVKQQDEPKISKEEFINLLYNINFLEEVKPTKENPKKPEGSSNSVLIRNSSASNSSSQRNSKSRSYSMYK